MILHGLFSAPFRDHCHLLHHHPAAISPGTRFGSPASCSDPDGRRPSGRRLCDPHRCLRHLADRHRNSNSGVAVKIAKLIGTSGEAAVHRTAHRRSGLPAAGHGTAYRGRLPNRCHSVRISYPGSGASPLLVAICSSSASVSWLRSHSSRLSGILCSKRHRSASAWKTGWKAFSFAITAFIVLCIRVSSRYPAGRHCGEIVTAYFIVIAATYLLACASLATCSILKM